MGQPFGVGTSVMAAVVHVSRVAIRHIAGEETASTLLTSNYIEVTRMFWHSDKEQNQIIYMLH